MATSFGGILSPRVAARWLRQHGWVPFIQMRGVRVWVGPRGELEEQDSALRLVYKKR